MDALSVLALGVASSAGGGGGTPDWDDVTNKPFDDIGSGLSVDSEGTLSATQELPTITGNAGKVLKVNSGATDVEWSDESTELPTITGNANKVLKVNSGASAVEWADESSELPSITGNASKVLKVNSGATAVEWANESTELPAIVSGDAGKVLTVNAGETGVEWAAGGGGGSSISGLVNGAGTNSLVQGTESSDATKSALTTGDSAIAGGYLEPNSTSGTYISATGKGSIAYGSFDKGQNTTASGVITATGRGSVALGSCYGNNYTTMTASGSASMVRGYGAGNYGSVTASGTASTAIGYVTGGGYGNATIKASGTASIATGTHFDYNGIVASGANSIARGYDSNITGCKTTAKGANSIAVQQGAPSSNAGASAYGDHSIAIGQGVVADEKRVIVLGKYNAYENPLTTETQYQVPALEENVPVFQSNHSYAVGDVMKQSTTSTLNYRRCTQAHTSAGSWAVEMSNYGSYWETVNFYTDSKYILVIGNGTNYNARSNALTVDWSGNLVCNNIPAPPSSDGNYVLQCSVSSGVATYSWVAQS